MSSQPPFGAFNEAPQSQSIREGYQDFACRWNGERVRVNATGRNTFQKCYLRSETGKNTKNSYVVEQHGPDAHQNPASFLPLPSELLDEDGTKQYLEVGLVLATEPELFLKEVKNGHSRNSEVEKARAERILERTEHPVLRAYTPCTEVRQQQAEIVVGCLFDAGHYVPKRIKSECVFFYREFQPQPDVLENGKSVSRNVRKHAITHNIKVASSVRPAQRTRINPNMNNTAAALRVQRPASLGSKLKILYAIFQNTGSEGVLDSMIKVLDDIEPDLTRDVAAHDEGLRAFMNFEVEFPRELVETLEKEIRAVVPWACRFQHDLITQVHGVLRMEHENGGVNGDMLPYRGVIFFINTCHRFHSDYVEDLQAFVLEIITITHEHCSLSPITSLNHNQPAVGWAPPLEVLQSLVNTMDQIKSLIKRSNTAVIDNHGPVLGNLTLDGLYSQLGRMVDVQATQIWMNQMASIQGTMVVGSNDEAANLLGVAIDLARRYLASLPRESGD